MNPRHLKKVKKDRKAVAPYNFVELPSKIVEAELECNGKLQDNDRYYSDRHTGKIECTLKTESPLYIRCGLTPTDFSIFSDIANEKLKPDQRKKKAEFFQYPSNLNPVLPGSSLRGMLRTLVEIISFGKIEKVSDQQKFFFRAVAADKEDPMSLIYKNKLKTVKAGYLEYKSNKWFIRPAEETHFDNGFIKIKENNIENIKLNLPSLITMEKSNYVPQYLEISFEEDEENINISENLTAYSYRGWLVTSGNMLDSAKTTEAERKNFLSRKEGRKYHYIISLPDHSQPSIEISEDAIKDYKNALTDFQQGQEKQFKNNPRNAFSKKYGCLEPGRPIFYFQDNIEKPIKFFGQSPNFRIPYAFNQEGKVVSAVDFIPKHIGESDKIDLADAIFGFVRRGKDKKEALPFNEKKEKREQSRAGRIFVSDAHYVTDEEGIWLKDNPNDTITPQILASPKPITFQHYLVQTTEEKPKLKHYGNKPNKDTVIRGHKLYWHKDDVGTGIQTDASPEEIENKQSQYTEIKPIKKGVSFKFTIHFENLSDVELGALLWIVTLANHDINALQLLGLDGKEKYCLSLGMGKPLGMGAVTIAKSELILNERSQNKPQQRYTQLFDDDNWLTGDRPTTADEYKSYIEAFEQYVIVGNDRVDELDLPEGCTDRKGLRLKDIPRIQMLLAMLSCNFPPVNETRYMEIERDISKGYVGKQVKQGEETKDEYEDRLILPTPLQIKRWEDQRKFDHFYGSSLDKESKNNSRESSPSPLARPPKPKP